MSSSRLTLLPYEADKSNKPAMLQAYLFGDVLFTRHDQKQVIKGKLTTLSQSWAIIDAIKRPDIAALLDIFEVEYRCLWKGDSAEHYSFYAPYLVKLEADSPFVIWLLENSQKAPLGIYLRSRLSLDKLAHHLRKFNQVYDEELKTWLMFRYYDPVTVKTLLPYLPVNDYLQFMDNLLFILADDVSGNQFLVLQ
ncbi:TPA: DUF4123 domain-containing protein [Providencia stuartii]|uniref:DUF4123 domain-containing protein n=1 Tax=Providencia TaxID=586 RepID=UPI002349ABCC|nr:MULTISPECIES: DUF4123 domain-containing protein [Providencia]MDX4946728.1 DUF4123 domain-containing protein [Providencia manganoxydans]HEF8771900.1 DUF4123 domain-containing protein [Providencia stuartii]